MEYRYEPLGECIYQENTCFLFKIATLVIYFSEIVFSLYLTKDMYIIFFIEVCRKFSASCNFTSNVHYVLVRVVEWKVSWYM